MKEGLGGDWKGGGVLVVAFRPFLPPFLLPVLEKNGYGVIQSDNYHKGHAQYPGNGVEGELRGGEQGRGV